MDNEPGQVSRRRVLVGTAWLTPAIVLAVSAPLAAASGEGATETVDVLSWGTISVSVTPSGSVHAHFQFKVDGGNQIPAGLETITYRQTTIVGPESYDSGVVAEPVSGQNMGPYDVEFDDVLPGTYTVTIRVWAEAYDPDADITYVATPIEHVEDVEVP